MPTNLPQFYKHDGRTKQAIAYIPVALHKRKSQNYLSNELMDSYEDAWDQVFDLVKTWKTRLDGKELRV